MSKVIAVAGLSFWLRIFVNVKLKKKPFFCRTLLLLLKFLDINCNWHDFFYATLHIQAIRVSYVNKSAHMVNHHKLRQKRFTSVWWNEALHWWNNQWQPTIKLYMLVNTIWNFFIICIQLIGNYLFYDKSDEQLLACGENGINANHQMAHATKSRLLSLSLSVAFSHLSFQVQQNPH